MHQDAPSKEPSVKMHQDAPSKETSAASAKSSGMFLLLPCLCDDKLRTMTSRKLLHQKLMSIINLISVL